MAKNKKDRYVNPLLSWGLIALEVVLVLVLYFIFVRA